MLTLLEHSTIGTTASLGLPGTSRGAAQFLALLRAILGAMGVAQADGALVFLRGVASTESTKSSSALSMLESIA